MASSEEVRARPNVLITGTPGTGKTLTASQIAERTGLSHINVGEVAKAGELYEGWDEQFQSHILDEDKVRGIKGCLAFIIHIICVWLVKLIVGCGHRVNQPY